MKSCPCNKYKCDPHQQIMPSYLVLVILLYYGCLTLWLHGIIVPECSSLSGSQTSLAPDDGKNRNDSKIWFIGVSKFLC